MPQNKMFEENKAIAQKWVQAFEKNDLSLWEESVSKDLKDQAPMYGVGEIDYNASKQIAEFYISSYKNIRFNNPVWLPGVDTLTLQPDGSVRVYGTWTGESVSTGRSFKNLAYHNFDFKNGKIISSGEFFDATGMINAVGPVQKTIIIATAKIKPGEFSEFQTLMDTEEGLKTTRNYKGCSFLEVTYNEESGMYFIIENWDSPESYSEYLNWRMTEDPSKLAERAFKHVVGGANGFKAYNPNTNYKFY
jgi:quinol monooxygenase YgiN